MCANESFASGCVPLSCLQDTLPPTYFVILELVYERSLPLATITSPFSMFVGLTLRDLRVATGVFILSVPIHPYEYTADYTHISLSHFKVVLEN